MLKKYIKFIEQLPDSRHLTKEDLIIPDLLIEKEKNLEMYYAPHNEYINREATIVIVGITPGWTQMKQAYETFTALKAKRKFTTDDILKETKKAASFSGSMRTNIIRMLDDIQLHDALGLTSTSAMFADYRSILHTTSMIKYPVFYKGKNYTGHQPKIENSPLLSNYAYHQFADEINTLSKSSLLIPLGKRVDAVINDLKQQDRIQQVSLKGFPHPSGANGHRIREFNKHQSDLVDKIDKWKRSGSENI